MTEEDFKNLSLLLSLTRSLVGAGDFQWKNVADAVRSLEHLRLEGEWADNHEVETRRLKADEDDIYRVFLHEGVLEARYASLKKLYDTRLEVTQAAVAAYKQKIADLEARILVLEEDAVYLNRLPVPIYF